MTKLDLNNCVMSDHETGWLEAVHNEIGEEGAEMLRWVLTSIRTRQAEERMYNDDYSLGPCETFGRKGHGVDWLAGVLVQCPALAHLDLNYNQIGPPGARKLAGVLPKCAALVYLDLSGNYMGAGGAWIWHGSGAMHSADSPQSPRQLHRRCWGKEFCRSAAAVHSAGSPQSLRQWDRGRCSLSHLDLSGNYIPAEVALKLRAAWSGDPLKLVLCKSG